MLVGFAGVSFLLFCGVLCFVLFLVVFVLCFVLCVFVGGGSFFGGMVPFGGLVIKGNRWDNQHFGSMYVALCWFVLSRVVSFASVFVLLGFDASRIFLAPCCRVVFGARVHCLLPHGLMSCVVLICVVFLCRALNCLCCVV